MEVTAEAGVHRGHRDTDKAMAPNVKDCHDAAAMDEVLEETCQQDLEHIEALRAKIREALDEESHEHENVISKLGAAELEEIIVSTMMHATTTGAKGFQHPTESATLKAEPVPKQGRSWISARVARRVDTKLSVA